MGSNPDSGEEPNQDWQHCQLHKHDAYTPSGSAANLQRLMLPKAEVYSQTQGSFLLFLQYYNLSVPPEIDSDYNAVQD